MSPGFIRPNSIELRHGATTGHWPISRRRLLGLPVVMLFANAARGEDDPRELRITVKDEFGSAPPDNVAAVLRSAAGEVWRHCPSTKFRSSGFYVYRDPRYPITHFDPDSEGRIVIGLATEDLYWAQYAFQFAHEFCHALLEHTDERQWKEPQQANHWLDESLCETASLFALRAMSKSWLTSPPYANWKDFAPRLAAYAEDRLASAAGQLPPRTTFAQWFAQQQSSLRERPVQRDKNLLIATQLLPLFEATPAGWEALPTLKLGKRDAGKSLGQLFDEWQTNAPEAQRAFIGKLAAIFPG